MYSYSAQLIYHIPDLVHVYEANWAFMVDHVQISHHQRTPLHRAAVVGHVDTVQCLIEAGGDIHSKDYEGVSE